jgi:hypothetical protein
MSEQPDPSVNADTKGSRPGVVSYSLMGVAIVGFIAFLIFT